eukprot:7105469-Alexandrium_andersonii.AAC.1
MSASLVGSEMCIRDSRGPARLQAAVDRPRPRALLCAQTGGRPARLAAGPVSYTHLTLPTICSV